ncbi:MAG: hypothetical protein KF681_03690 [Bdellovibrionaceae bacterium]|nr:hypothetical protein [Pseudobdellovibrionaceae bacterium]
MLPYARALNTLRKLESDFQAAARNDDRIFACKLATLEACGWIEESFDLVFYKFSLRRISSLSAQSDLRTMVNKNFGFHFDKHIRKNILTPLLGCILAEVFESKLDAALLIPMKASLGTLKLERDKLAHTYTKGVTPNINSPTVTIGHFNTVRQGLGDFETKLLSARLKI